MIWKMILGLLGRIGSVVDLVGRSRRTVRPSSRDAMLDSDRAHQQTTDAVKRVQDAYKGRLARRRQGKP